MGELYHATDTTLGRYVALKVPGEARARPADLLISTQRTLLASARGAGFRAPATTLLPKVNSLGTAPKALSPQDRVSPVGVEPGNTTSPTCSLRRHPIETATYETARWMVSGRLTPNSTEHL